MVMASGRILKLQLRTKISVPLDNSGKKLYLLLIILKSLCIKIILNEKIKKLKRKLLNLILNDILKIILLK